MLAARRWVLPALATSLLALAGCGSTVPLGSAPGTGLAGGALAGQGALGATGPDAAAAAATGQVGGAAGPAGGPAGAVGAGSLAAGQPAGPSGPAAGQPAGRRPPPLEIGTYYLNGGNAALDAAGFGGLVIPDNKPVFDAFVKYTNSHGGWGGRQLVPVYYQYNEGADPATQDAAACSTFTQDHHVYLVVGGINSGAGELLPCLARHDVPLFAAATQGDEAYFAQYHRYAYEPDELNLTSGISLLVADLQARGYLASVHKVGVIQYPGPQYDRAVAQGLVPALRRVGLSLADHETTTSASDNSAIATGSASAELRFRSEGIDLVVFVTPGGAAETYFMNNAQTQGYHPKYGIWSADSPYVLASTAPKAQLAGSIGVGYLPGLDVASAQDPTAQTPAAKACLRFGTQLGVDESGLGNALVRTTCDVFGTLGRVMAATPAASTSTAVFEQQVDAIGGSFAPASTFAVRWEAGHHDAADGYRDLTYDGGCSCFTYVGPTHRLS